MNSSWELTSIGGRAMVVGDLCCGKAIVDGSEMARVGYRSDL